MGSPVHGAGPWDASAFRQRYAVRHSEPRIGETAYKQTPFDATVARRPGALTALIQGRYEGSFWDCGANISGSRSPPGLTPGGADGVASAVEIGQPTGIGGRSSSIRFCARSSRMKTTRNATRTTRPTDTRTPYATALGMTILHYPTPRISPRTRRETGREGGQSSGLWSRGTPMGLVRSGRGAGARERSRRFLEVGEDTRDVSGSRSRRAGPHGYLVRAGILRSYRTGSKLLRHPSVPPCS